MYNPSVPIFLLSLLRSRVFMRYLSKIICMALMAMH
jgi:hypothetical protein